MSATTTLRALQSNTPALFLLLFVALLAARFSHVGVLWVDESYGMAAAQAILSGKALYRDLWFDKPPLYAWFYLVEGGLPGWPVRLLGASFSLLCSWLAFGAARALFGEWEGRVAALLMAFFLVFGIPSAVVSVAPDLLTVPFALGVAWMAARKRAVLAGFLAGAAILANAKALFLAPVVLFWLFPQWPQVLAGYLAGAMLTPALLLVHGSLADYWQQVWVWGAVYSRDSHLDSPFSEGLLRTANWIGFHAALVLPAGFYFLKRIDRQASPLAMWFLLALASVAGGWRFFPRYYFALLPVAVVIAAHGLRLIPPRARIALLLITLSIPAIRFGKPQLLLAWQTVQQQPITNRDLALWSDARQVAQQIRAAAQPGDTLLVWGYRPELNALAALPPGTRFLDSQPLTGVIADRHLATSKVSYPEISARNRKRLALTQPTWIADGLGPINPALRIDGYPDLSAWFSSYQRVSVSGSITLYRLRHATSERQGATESSPPQPVDPATGSPRRPNGMQ